MTCHRFPRSLFVIALACLTAFQLCWLDRSRSALRAAEPRDFDVVVFGGTSAGIAAAVQVKRMGGTVVVLEPSQRIGGLTTGGLGQTDIGNKAAIGGVAREFYERVRKYYDQPEHWKWQRREEYRDGGQTRTGQGEEAMWTFEPSAALTIMQDFVREYDIPVVYQQRLERTGPARSGEQSRGVTKDHARIVSIRMESGEVYRGRMFIDATYEGDLLAAAGVSYVVGREANPAYGETLNGVQTQQAKLHQLLPHVDPYVIPGDPASGLLPGINPRGPGDEGTGDHRVQAYCFRMCLTDHPKNRIPFARPTDYDPRRYELLLRNFEAGERGMPWINSEMPNRKTDTNNRTGFSTDFIGGNYTYPEASYDERGQIIAEHRSYQQGLMWTLANDPRVPEQIRREVARWGLCRDEFTDGAGWQEQLYVREARRMIGAYVMTQHNCQGQAVADRPIGLAAYTMDSHNTQRYVDAAGHARNEGDVEVGGFPPYGIDYGSITPQLRECDNLLVPVCLSATHIAFGSIRMEPVFMVLGQSAATAAMQAIADDAAIQAIDYAQLRARMLADGQVLAWTGPTKSAAQAIAPQSLPGIVIDDAAGQRQGFELESQIIGPFIGVGYRHDANTNKGQQALRFTCTLPAAGRYEVRLAYTPHENRATNVPVKIQHAAGSTTVHFNQRQPPKHAPFASCGAFHFAAGETTIEITNADTDGYVVVDAIQLLPVESGSRSTKWTVTATIAAEEAVQAAAADDQFIYAIANSKVAKYDRLSGARLALSTGEAQHLNSGFFRDGRMYCAHSNYPLQPERSEIKVLDPPLMELATFHDFGDFGGSLTWCVWHDGHWWCNFAKYGQANAETFLVQFNEHWQEQSRWTYPVEVIHQLGAYSLSGGIWRDGALLVTDHDHPRLYQLRLPTSGKVLELVSQIEVPFTGQGIAVDPQTNGLIGIDRARRRIVLAQPAE